MLCRGSWEGEMGQEGISLVPPAGTCFHSPCLLAPLLLPAGNTLGHPWLLGCVCLGHLSNGCLRVAPAVPLPLPVPDTPYLSTSPFSSATRLSRAGTGCFSPRSYFCQPQCQCLALALPVEFSLSNEAFQDISLDIKEALQ